MSNYFPVSLDFQDDEGEDISTSTSLHPSLHAPNVEHNNIELLIIPIVCLLSGTLETASVSASISPSIASSPWVALSYYSLLFVPSPFFTCSSASTLTLFSPVFVLVDAVPCLPAGVGECVSIFYFALRELKGFDKSKGVKRRRCEHKNKSECMNERLFREQDGW